MKKLITILLIFMVSTLQIFAQTYAFKDGNWLVNGKFNQATYYSINGFFTKTKPVKIDSTIDLKDKFCIPPFAEAHTHKLDNQKELIYDQGRLLKQGVFYAMVLNNFSSNVEKNRNFLLSENKIEVAYANGGITATDQHPSFAYERILSDIKEWWLPINTAKIKNSRKAENDAYWFMDNKKDVDEKWELFLKTKPDLVKVYLMNTTKNETQNPKSLSESTIKYIVGKANKAKLRVVAHIESFEDLKVGLQCGINIYGHLPYYNVNFLKELPAEIDFSETEKKLIRKLKPIIIPTLSFNEEFSIVRSEKNNYQGEFDSTSFFRSLKFQKESIKKLTENGFVFAFGSDRDSFLPEFLYWLKYNIFSLENSLTIATKTTPQLIFPKRKIGEIKEGYEASFLVLNSNPLLNMEAIKNLEYGVKQGRILMLN